MSQDLRRTRQAAALERAFAEAGRPLSPKEALALGQDEVPELSLATVYRWLKRETERGTLVPVELPGLASRYELASAAGAHHHHFHCRSCERVFDLDGCTGGVNALAPPGFLVEDHNLLLQGLCGECSPKRSRRT